MTGYIERNGVVWFYEPQECAGCHTMHALFRRKVASGKPALVCVANCAEKIEGREAELKNIALALDFACPISAVRK